MDILRKDENKTFWDIFEWDLRREKGFDFSPTAKKWHLDFDLDCFMMQWMQRYFPWDDEIFIDQFTNETKDSIVGDWTAKRFIKHLIKKAGLISIAMEPNYCWRGLRYPSRF